MAGRPGPDHDTVRSRPQPESQTDRSGAGNRTARRKRWGLAHIVRMTEAKFAELFRHANEE